jgi:pimeloyl-ACP methyl ester carboxylesterase
MNRSSVHSCSAVRRRRVIALHCSGAGGRQWTPLAEALSGQYEMITPEHYGCGSSGPWSGEHAFTIADEAARTITLIDQSDEKVHLVGHSYGGGVALHVALARRQRVASVALYEPSAFHLLPYFGAAAIAAHAEITALAREVSQAILVGNYRGAAVTFVEYWNGPGGWQAMRPQAQDALVRWTPKAALDFHALINDVTSPGAYRTLDCPVLILRGEHALAPSRLVAEGLFGLLPASEIMVVRGAGHMGPLTHASEVSRLIVRHLVAAGACSGKSGHPFPDKDIRRRNESRAHPDSSQPGCALAAALAGSMAV